MLRVLGSRSVPGGKSSGSRGSCRLQGNVLPLDAVGWQAPAEVAAIGTASGSVTPVLVECRCLKALIAISGSNGLTCTISEPGIEPRPVSELQVTVETVV